MTKSDFLSFKQVVSLVKAIGHKRTILIMGENGIGKTSVHKALCADPDFADFIKPSPIDCTQWCQSLRSSGTTSAWRRSGRCFVTTKSITKFDQPKQKEN
jgi:Mg-chelatase subunit ChlI